MSETRVISYKIEVDDAPVKSLKQQLREATLEAQRLATAEIVDEKALQAAIQKTAQLKDQMMDVNEQVTELAAGSPFEKMKNSIGGVQGALMNLDFDKAATSAKALTNTITNLNPAAMASQFSAFGGVVMQLGRAVGMLTVKFVQMGIALLANPIFLLVAAIVAIVAAVVVFLHKIGVLQKILDVLMIPINLLIDGFYALTDAIGLTSKAAEEEAEKIKTAYEDSAKAIDERGKILEAQVGNELELLKARSTGTEEDLEKIRKKEEQLLFVKQKGAQDSLTLAQSTLNQMKNNSEITEEELEKQRLLVLDLQLAYDKAKTASLSYFAKQISDASIAKTKADEDALKASKEAADKASQEADRRAKEASQKAEQRRKELIAAEQARIVFLEDLEDQAIVDADEREDALLVRKVERAQKEMESSLLYQQATADEKLKIDASFDAQILEIENKRKAADDLKEKEKENKERAHLANMNALQLEYNAMLVGEDDFQGKLDLKQAEYDEEQRLLKEKLDTEAITQEEYNLRKKMGEQQLAADITAIKKAQADKEAEEAKKLVDWEIAQKTYLKDTVLGIANETVDLLKAVGGKSKGVALAALGIEKGVAIANVVINTMKELSANAATSALNPANAATFGAAGAAQLLKMNAVSKIRAGLRIATIAATGISGAKSISAGDGGGGGIDGGGGGTPPISASMGQAQNTPQINMFQNNQNNQPMSGVNRVSVVDYTDIQNTGNRVAMLQNAVSLG
jgi:hypothetical protein